MGETYVGTPGTSSLYMNSLANVDPDVRFPRGSHPGARGNGRLGLAARARPSRCPRAGAPA